MHDTTQHSLPAAAILKVLEPKPKTAAAIISANLAKLMSRQKWTQLALSKHSGVAQRTIAKILAAEGDNFELGTLAALAKALGCSLEAFVSDGLEPKLPEVTPEEALEVLRKEIAARREKPEAEKKLHPQKQELIRLIGEFPDDKLGNLATFHRFLLKERANLGLEQGDVDPPDLVVDDDQ